MAQDSMSPPGGNVRRMPNTVQVVLEDWRPEVAAAIWADPSPNALRVAFDDFAELLASLVDRPDEVTLIVPVDVRDAVMRRDQSVEYSLERGSGMVGGRTMHRDDGGFDVIIDGNYLGESDGQDGFKVTAAGQPTFDPVSRDLLRRMIAHEAQHVIMGQRGTGFDDYQPDLMSGGAAARWLFEVARKMCDEHRAEWNAAQVVGVDPPSVRDVLDVLCHLGEALAAANMLYQQSNHTGADVARLRDDVYTACVAYWTQVAYWVAEYRRDGAIADVPEEITRLVVWQRYVGPTWQSLTDALARLPVALTTSTQTLHQAALGVAGAVSESLTHIGFRHIDGPSGQAFYIDRTDFPSARQ